MTNDINMEDLRTKVFEKMKDEINLTKKELKAKGISSGVRIYTAGGDHSENSLRGFIIIKVNDEDIHDAESAVKILDALSRNRRYKIIIEMLNLDEKIERNRFR